MWVTYVLQVVTPSRCAGDVDQTRSLETRDAERLLDEGYVVQAAPHSIPAPKKKKAVKKKKKKKKSGK